MPEMKTDDTHGFTTLLLNLACHNHLPVQVHKGQPGLLGHSEVGMATIYAASQARVGGSLGGGVAVPRAKPTSLEAKGRHANWPRSYGRGGMMIRCPGDGYWR